MLRTRKRSVSVLSGCIGVLATALALPAISGQDQAPPAKGPQGPVLRISGAQVERVTVDVVVLDKDGRPVPGLRQDDFTIFDEGEPRSIKSFDEIKRGPGKQASPEPTPPPRIATNPVRPEAREPGRTFVILFDDMHLSPQSAKNAKLAVEAFLDRGVVAGDLVTLVATSGAAWWSTRMYEGREDLRAIIERLDGHRILEPASQRVSDYEALQIVEYQDTTIGMRVQDRFDRFRTSLIQQADPGQQTEAYRSMMEIYGRGQIDMYVHGRALETYQRLGARIKVTLEAVERATKSLAEGRGRKALLLVSEGFVMDPAQNGFKKVVEATRQVNAALYFIDANGLRTLDPMYDAEMGHMVDSHDAMAISADLGREGDGAVKLAEDTGGFSIRDSNDFQSGLVKIGLESQNFYLIGYDPGDIARNGHFRKIQVKVNRPGATVRARKGYYAPSGDSSPEAPQATAKTDPVLQHALDAAGPVSGIPLRMTTYVMEDLGADQVRALMVADVDVSELSLQQVDGASVSTLDTLAVIASRERGAVQRNDQQVVLQRRAAAKTGPLWYSFVRNFTLATGHHQARLVVRDPATDRVGSVIYEFDIPSQDHLRVSTPVLTDTLQASVGGGPAPALLARRAFAHGATLYCRFDVFGAKKDPKGVPQVRSGYSLRRKPEGTLASVPPTRIEPTSLGALARMVQVPLGTTPPGDYELVLTVKDELTGESRELVEPFSVEEQPTPSRG